MEPDVGEASGVEAEAVEGVVVIQPKPPSTLVLLQPQVKLTVGGPVGGPVGGVRTARSGRSGQTGRTSRKAKAKASLEAQRFQGGLRFSKKLNVP